LFSQSEEKINIDDQSVIGIIKNNDSEKNIIESINNCSSLKDITFQDKKEKGLLYSTLSNNDKTSFGVNLESFLDLNDNKIDEFNVLEYKRENFDTDFNFAIKESNYN